MPAKPIQASEKYVTGDGMDLDTLKAMVGDPVSYERVVEHFQTRIPEYYNLAGETVLRQVAGGNGEAIALVAESADGTINRFSYAELADRSSRLSRMLQELGVTRGTVVACYLGAGLEAALTYLAVFRLGGIVAPLSQLYGPDTVIHALVDSGASILISESDLWGVSPIRGVDVLRWPLSCSPMPMTNKVLSISINTSRCQAMSISNGPGQKRRPCCYIPPVPPGCPRVSCTPTEYCVVIWRPYRCSMNWT